MQSDDVLDRVPPPLPLFLPAPGTETDRGPDLTSLAESARLDDYAEPLLAATLPAGRDAGGERAEPVVAAAEDEKPVESSQRRLWPFALAISIALHLAPFALLLRWPIAPAEIAPAIPVQLVIEPPKPAAAPPPPPAAEKKRPAGRLASEDMGSPAAKQRQQPGDEPEPAAPQEAPTQMVSALPPPKPSALPLPEPAPLPQQQAMLPPPKPTAPRARRQDTWVRLPEHLGIPGPAATRDEYLAYCNALIRRHFDMLPTGFIGERRGLTVLSLLVLDDGRIARIAVARSSGYRDIDERVERMVAAVGRFPPLPQWFQGSEMGLEYELPFPAGLARR